MSDFYTRKPLPTGRIVFYGFLAAAAVAALGYFQNDPQYIFAIIAGLAIGGVGFTLSWMRSNVKPIPGEAGQPVRYRYPTWVHWLSIISLTATIALKLWHIMQEK